MLLWYVRQKSSKQQMQASNWARHATKCIAGGRKACSVMLLDSTTRTSTFMKSKEQCNDAAHAASQRPHRDGMVCQQEVLIPQTEPVVVARMCQGRTQENPMQVKQQEP